MAKEIQREELGIFFFQGFLEGGKTSYIQKLIEDEEIKNSDKAATPVTEAEENNDENE